MQLVFHVFIAVAIMVMVYGRYGIGHSSSGWYAKVLDVAKLYRQIPFLPPNESAFIIIQPKS